MESDKFFLIAINGSVYWRAVTCAPFTETCRNQVWGHPGVSVALEGVGEQPREANAGGVSRPLGGESDFSFVLLTSFLQSPFLYLLLFGFVECS